MADDLPEKLKSGEPARLFPVLAETSKEGRALSVLLACVANIDDLGRTLLSTVGQRVGVRARVKTFTEVVLENAPEGVSGRPDGMIIIEIGRRSWSALIEAKVRRARLDSDQVQAYLRLARANGVDAVITISNEFTAVPHHHPIRVSRLPKGVGLFHWSWTSILTYAKVLLAAKEVEDREQLFLLAELVRFLDHPSTGVLRFDRMGGDWRNVVTSVVAGAKLARTSDAVVDTVASWHQECRDLALKLTELVNANVVIRLPMAHRTDPRRRLVDEAATFCNTATLAVEFNVPAAASPIKVQADLRTRSIQVSMSLRAPGDRKSSRARTNWLLRQLVGSDAKDLHVQAVWSGRRTATMNTLEVVRADPDAIRAENPALSPRAFEVMLVRDAGARFSGTKTFVDELETSVLRFYAEVGQRLKPWQPSAPHIVAQNEPIQKESAAHSNDKASTQTGPLDSSEEQHAEV